MIGTHVGLFIPFNDGPKMVLFLQQYFSGSELEELTSEVIDMNDLSENKFFLAGFDSNNKSKKQFNTWLLQDIQYAFETALPEQLEIYKIFNLFINVGYGFGCYVEQPVTKNKLTKAYAITEQLFKKYNIPSKYITIQEINAFDGMRYDDVSGSVISYVVSEAVKKNKNTLNVNNIIDSIRHNRVHYTENEIKWVIDEYLDSKEFWNKMSRLGHPHEIYKITFIR